MSKLKIPNLTLITSVLWVAIFFSALALVYHTRWFISYLQDNTSGVVPNRQMPFVWFVVQICNNIIFLFVGFLLFQLLKKYKQTGFFDNGSLKAFNGVIGSCIGLTCLGAIQIVSNNFYEVHFNEWTSIVSVSNLLFRSFTRLLVFQEPQTMYFLSAIILWSVKQFVTKALIIKNENEAFV